MADAEAKRPSAKRRRAAKAAGKVSALRRLERELRAGGCERIAGVDEVGVGPLAGPVVAAAVCLPERVPAGIDDSKKLTPAVRERLACWLAEGAVDFGVGVATVEEIEAVNVYQAALLAMRRAVLDLGSPPDHVLVDARTIPELAIAQSACIHGDAEHLVIGAASVLAKVTRDNHLVGLHARWPVYGFDRHKGYASPEHLRALKQHGPCPAHRMSFVRDVLGLFSKRYYALKERLESCADDVFALEVVKRDVHRLRAELDPAEQRRLGTMLRWKLKAAEARAGGDADAPSPPAPR